MSMTILIVEPEHELRSSVQHALREKGYRLYAFASAAGALESAKDVVPDLCLLTAAEDSAMDELVASLRAPGSRSQVVWIAPPGDSEVESLVRRRHPRGLLGRSNLSKEACQLALRVNRTQRRGRLLQGSPNMLGESPPILEVKATIDKIASAGASTVLLTGESGTGKEVAARLVHSQGQRVDGPFVEVDCATIPANLMESQLFGHEAGSFTDARETKMGLMELGQGGTVFLDEIGELEFGLQSKLLRVLDSRRLRRVGSSEEIPLDIHLVAATNRDLESEVRNGRFRADLFYRLDVVRIHLPPLRHRGSDVLLLADQFFDDSMRRLGRSGITLSDEVRKALQDYRWPGNVRELKNHMERLALLAQSDNEVLTESLLPAGRDSDAGNRIKLDFSDGPVAWEAIERAVFSEALRIAEGNVSEAARLLGLGRGAFRYRLARHDLTDFEDDSKKAA
ncbi:MAG: sigma-54-dependent Fis family transcriptional regulator [Candidatus Eisenbacteria bacterium]|uniref:Sigma-54-dependent Fis family transcriptional regulator n=1 Tax=Eiseniibacteriota bacterium TaxID=2212470 RepID=A0A7Y2E8Z1_UNCEI|nr:sigma-54-dependent Fis family transcriptional regulator [Candidatus Eisenbacteria bacterium]